MHFTRWIQLVLFCTSCQLLINAGPEGLVESGHCNDGVDNDGNGLTDCEDPTCAASGCQVFCGDTFLQDQEECDDGNQFANDGCNALCQLEADVFVRCNTDSKGDGSLENPFHSLQDAIESETTGNNDTLMILPDSPVSCQGSGVISKNLRIQGLASLDDIDLPPVPEIDGVDFPAIQTTKNTQVILQNLIIRSRQPGATVENQGGTIALLRVEIANEETIENAKALRSTAGILFIDQSIVQNSPQGAIELLQNTSAVIANTLFIENGTPQGQSPGAILIDNSTAVVLYSNFHENQSSNPGGAIACVNGGNAKIDSSIFLDTNTLLPISGQNCELSFSDLFGIEIFGDGNFNKNPKFITIGEQEFHLENDSPCIDTANPTPLSLPFDPIARFSVDVFSHDFLGNPRPIGGGPDVGFLEEN